MICVLSMSSVSVYSCVSTPWCFRRRKCLRVGDTSGNSACNSRAVPFVSSLVTLKGITCSVLSLSTSCRASYQSTPKCSRDLISMKTVDPTSAWCSGVSFLALTLRTSSSARACVRKVNGLSSLFKRTNSFRASVSLTLSCNSCDSVPSSKIVLK